MAVSEYALHEAIVSPAKGLFSRQFDATLLGGEAAVRHLESLLLEKVRFYNNLYYAAPVREVAPPLASLEAQQRIHQDQMEEISKTAMLLDRANETGAKMRGLRGFARKAKNLVIEAEFDQHVKAVGKIRSSLDSKLAMQRREANSQLAVVNRLKRFAEKLPKTSEAQLHIAERFAAADSVVDAETALWWYHKDSVRWQFRKDLIENGDLKFGLQPKVFRGYGSLAYRFDRDERVEQDTGVCPQEVIQLERRNPNNFDLMPAGHFRDPNFRENSTRVEMRVMTGGHMADGTPNYLTLLVSLPHASEFPFDFELLGLLITCVREDSDYRLRVGMKFANWARLSPFGASDLLRYLPPRVLAHRA